MHDLGSYELMLVDVVNRFRLWMIGMILCPKLKLLDVMSYFGQWKT